MIQWREHMTDTESRETLLLIGLVSLFLTGLVTSQLISNKIAVLTLPVLGAVTYPTGTIAYAATFFSSDVISEVYGKTTAQYMINIAFFMNFVLLALVWLAIAAPVADQSVPQETFETVLSGSGNIVLGSLVAYVVSQNWDVLTFHAIRGRTGESMLWLRNLVSTGTSQLVDTILFTVVAFAVAPAVFGFGFSLSTSALISTIVGQYVLKLGIAALDTPLVYGAVWTIRNQLGTVQTPQPT